VESRVREEKRKNCELMKVRTEKTSTLRKKGRRECTSGGEAFFSLCLTAWGGSKKSKLNAEEQTGEKGETVRTNRLAPARKRGESEKRGGEQA